jgi:hypothetical protein
MGPALLSLAVVLNRDAPLPATPSSAQQAIVYDQG